MIKFDKPKNFEGVQFCEELEALGVSINKDTSPLIDGNGDFWLDIDAADTQKAKDVLNNHIPKPRPKPTIEDKLQTAGLTIDELKTALGL
jgi:hypothetical protein